MLMGSPHGDASCLCQVSLIRVCKVQLHIAPGAFIALVPTIVCLIVVFLLCLVEGFSHGCATQDSQSNACLQLLGAISNGFQALSPRRLPPP